MRQTLVTLVDNMEKLSILAADGGGPKNITKPKQPGKSAGTPTVPGQPKMGPGMQGQPQGMPQPPQPGQQPQLPLAEQLQTPPNAMPYPAAPRAQVMPGQPTTPTPGVPTYPGGHQDAAPPAGVGPKKAKGAKGKGKPEEEDEEENQNDPMAPNQSPAAGAANHVAQHVTDPLGATHNLFQNLGQKQLEYAMEQENARRALAPVHAVLKHVDQLHQLHQYPQSPDEAMGYQDPNNPGGNNVPNTPGATPPGGQPQQGMTKGPGAVNNAEPAQSGKIPGSAPGVGAGPQESVRPPKKGMAKPGGGVDPGKPGSDKQKPGAAGKGKRIQVSVEGASTNKVIQPRGTSLDAALDMMSLYTSPVKRS